MSEPKNKKQPHSTSAIVFDDEGKIRHATGEFSDLVSPECDSVKIPDALKLFIDRITDANGAKFKADTDSTRKLIEVWSQFDRTPIEVRLGNGSWRMLSSFPHENGTTCLISTDSTDQKNKEEISHFLNDKGPLPLWINEIDGEILFSNSAANELFEVDAFSMVGRNAAEFIVNDKDLVEQFSLIKEYGYINNYLFQCVTDKGRDIWNNVSAKLVNFQGRDVIVCIIKDVTDQKHTEDQSNRVMNMLRDAVDSLSEGFALYDEDSRLVLFNETYRQMNNGVEDLLKPGLEFEILIRESARRGIYSEAIGAEQDWVSKQLNFGIEYVQDYELKHTDGSYSLVSVHPTKIGGFVITRTDISAMKKAESVQSESDNLVRTVLETSSAAVIMAHIGSGEIIYRSPAATELFGAKKYASDHYAYKEDRADYITLLLADGQVDNIRIEFIDVNGKVFPGSFSGRIIEYKGEEVVVSNVTNLKEQYEAEAMIRKVLEACPVPIQMTKANTGELIFRSPETIALFGDVKIATSYYVDKTDRDNYVEKLKKDGWVDNLNAKLLNSKGEEFYGAVSARLIDFNGESVIVSNTRDLTDELAVQEELSSQREMLFQNEKMSALGELLAGVAHELNNPLSIVVGHSLMLREEVKSEPTLKRIEKISSAAERCAKIVKTFLAMARQQPAKMEKSNVNSILSTAVDVASYGGKSEDIEVVLLPGANLPDIVVDGDQITQVIINLIINAEQAMSKSEIGDKIEIRSSHNIVEGAIEICILDNGPGVPENIRPRIFEPFFTTKDIGDGTGIGLAFCHRTILSHGGHIWLDQNHKIGARFCISLPLTNKQSEPSTVVETLKDIHTRKRILVVDDEIEVAELISEILMKEGYEVETANNGNAAISRLHQANFDVVLTDLNMPKMDGRELFEKVIDNFPKLKNSIGFITGDTMGITSQNFLARTKRPYMEKPVSPSELRKLVYKIVNDESAINDDQ